MPIPPLHSHRFLYHSTHIRNLKGILKHGFLSQTEQRRRGLKHHTIAEASIQDRRMQMQVPCGPGGVVHDYVPLYFSKLSPMLLKVVTSKNVDQMLLLHFAYPITILNRDDVVFTDGGANRNTPPNFFTDPSELSRLRWDAIDLRKWKSQINGLDVKNERMAEALVHTTLDPRDAAFVVLWNDWVKERVAKIYEEAEMAPPEIMYDGYDGYHTYTNFQPGLPSDMLRRSIASGPFWISHIFDETLKTIAAQGPGTPRYGSLREMLTALQSQGLSALPETAELQNLESVNEVHRHDVGTHTIKVVEALRGSTEFSALSVEDKVVVEVAAYLHDIGKGPKSRWSGCGGKQQVDADHPLRSMQMLPRILKEEVSVDQATTRVLRKLVGYHDLVGDIIGKGRDRQQLVDVAETLRDLDLLIALGKADMTSVSSSWGWTGSVRLPELRVWAAAKITAG